MFCPGCGNKFENEGVNEPCQHCGHTPKPVAEYTPPGYTPPTGAHVSPDVVNTFNNIAGNLKSRFSFNQLVVLGGAALLFICLFLPFRPTVRISGMGFMPDIVTRSLGYSIAFDSMYGFLTLLLPLLIVAAFAVLSALSVIKPEGTKLCIASFSFLGLYLSLTTLFSLGNAASVGAILFFILWLCVAAAAFMEYKGINLVKF